MTVIIRRAKRSSRRARWAAAVLGLALSAATLALWPLTATANHPEPQLPLTATIVQNASDCAPPAPDIGTAIPTGTVGNATTPPDRNNTSSSNEHTPGSPATLVIHANAESDPKENTLDVSGSHNVFDGLINSRSHLKVSGSWNLMRHGTDYGQRSEPGKVAFDLTGSNNCFSPIPTQTYENAPPASPAGFPLFSDFDPDQDGNILEHFAPGTTAANAAVADPTPGPQYFVCGIPDPDGGGTGAVTAPGCSGSGASAIMDRSVQGQQLETGLYFVTGRVKLSGSNLNARLTIVSGQQLNVNGSFQGQGVNVFRPYTDAGGAIFGDLLFASQWDEAAPLSGPTFPDGSTANDSPNTDKAEDALKVEGSLSRFEGIIVATNGRTEIAGEQLDFRCPVMGDRVRVNGSKNYFNSTGCVPSPSLAVDKTPDGGPAGTINAGQAAVFTIVITNSGAGTATGVTLDDDLPNTGGLTWSLTSAVKSAPPPGGTNVAAGCNPGAGGALPNAQELDCSFGDLAAGQTITVVVTSSATTSGGNCGQLPNGNGVLDNGLSTPSTADDAIADASNTEPVTNPGQIIVACPDVSVVKTPDESNPAGPANDINAGEDAVFTITFTNNGPGVASSVPLSDQLPGGANGLVWSIVSQGFGPGFTGGNACSVDPANLLTCQVNNMASGASYRVVVKATTSAANCGSINNLVTITPAGDINPVNNSDTGEIDVACPDVQVDKTPDGGPAGTINAGQAAVFTIVIANSGAGTALGVTLDDDLPNDGGITWSLTSAVKSPPPAGGTDVSANCNPGPGGALPSPKELDCDFGNLAPGQTITVVVTSSATSSGGNCGELVNGNGVLDNGLDTADTADDAIADAANDGPDTDPGQIIVACPDVSVVKTPDESNPAGPANDINAGEDAVFTITFTNNGPGVASSVPLSDQLPTANGLDWSIVSQGFGPGFTGGTACTIDPADLLTCQVNDMASGASYRVVVKSATDEDNCGSIPNTVTITPAGDINPVNNSDTGEIDVACPDVQVEKTPDGGAAGTINAGDAAVFTIVISNTGAGVATGVTLDDDLPNDGGITWSLTSAVKSAPPPGGTDVSAGCNPGAGGALPDAKELDCDFGDLAPGQTVTVVVTSSANTADTCGELANGNGQLDNGLETADAADDAIADATNDDPDEDPGQIVVACADVQITKTPDGGLAGTIEAGDAAVFTIVITNDGLGTATGVTLDDDLPNDGNITWSLTSAVKSPPPPGGTDVSAGCNPGAGGALPDAKELDCDFGSLAPGQTITVVVTSSATSSAGNCGELPNGNGVLDNGLDTADTADDAIADATNDDPDEDPGQIIVACPDVSVAKSPDETDPAGPANDINAGQDAVFTILVTNNGPGVASSTTLSDTLPFTGGLDWSIVSQGLGPGFTGGAACEISDGGTSIPPTNDVLSCTITNLAENGQYQIVIKSATTAAACGTIPNLVEITPAGDINLANNSDPGEIDVNCAAIRILKQSTKTGNPLVKNAGAVFAVDGPDDGPTADFSVRDDNSPVHADPGKADETTVLGVGIVCVSGLAPGSYTVNETSPPSGYGASSQTNVTAIAVTGTNCTDNLPALADTAQFQNPPLADIQVNYRDGGSTETSLTSIDCDNNGAGADTLDLVPAATWEKSVTHLGLAIDPSPRTIVCTIVIDP